MTDLPSETYVQAAIDRILGYNETDSVFDRVVNALIDWINSIEVSVFGSGNLPQVVIFLFTAALVSGTVLIAVRLLRTRSLAAGMVVVSCETDPWQEAAIYAARGDFRRALQFLFVYHLQALASQGLIEVHGSKTNAQYELELRRQGYGHIRQFHDFKNTFNASRYGHRDVDYHTFANWRDYCVKHAGGEGRI
ncbi:MAG: hypothetical protein FWG10_01695 [Eubacteriaceae bacterium]|nr:hypothetical protein [Eubacteriaceae bacterium]